MAPDAGNERVRAACRRFLNSRVSRNLDPALFIGDLLEAKVIDYEEAELVRSQPTLPHRQYVSATECLAWKCSRSGLGLDLFPSTAACEKRQCRIGCCRRLPE